MHPCSEAQAAVTWGDAWQTAISTFFLSNFHFLSISPLTLLSLSLPRQISPHLHSICFLSFPRTSFCLFSSGPRFLFKPLPFSLVIRLSLFAAAWCSVSRDWAWRYSTTRHDSWTLPTSSWTPLPSPPYYPLSPLQTPTPPLSTLTFLNSFCKYMFTQCKWMVSTAVKIEQTVHFTMWDN